MDSIAILIFALVYFGILLGRLPGLALDRTGVALLGAIAMLAFGRFHTEDLAAAVDISTIALLFGLMIVSAQFRLAGAYSYIVRRFGTLDTSPGALLAALLVTAGVLSAVLINDVICLAMAPVIIELCARRSLNPVPFLLGLACAANIGSAATLIGNPQNILIGQTLDMSFSGYLIESLVPVLIGLAIVWLVLMLRYRHDMTKPFSIPEIDTPPFTGWQTTKGVAVILVVLTVFLFGLWPRDLTALAAAGLLLCSRRMRSREMLGLVDWQLLTLFLALFIVNFVLKQSGSLALITDSLASYGVDLTAPVWLFVSSAALSNIVSNVPAVMLLLPSAVHPSAGAVLALSSTLAGNLIIVGSIANIIVVDQAERLGVRITWAEHARTGIPVTLLTLGVAAFWLWVRF